MQERLQDAMEQKIKEKRHRLSLYLEQFNGLSPLRKLNQGYSYVSDSGGKSVTSVSQVRQGDSLLIYVTDGTIETVVQDTKRRSVPMADEKKAQKTLEEAFAELDILAGRLEDRETSLEDSFTLYKQGMELLKYCNDKLDTVEKKMLQMNEDGTLSEFSR